MAYPPTNLLVIAASATSALYTLSLHDALPISRRPRGGAAGEPAAGAGDHRARGRAAAGLARSEEHTSELQSLRHLVCRLLLEKKKNVTKSNEHTVTIRPHIANAIKLAESE